MIGCIVPPLLKMTLSSYNDLKLDYISFLHRFLSILYILKNDKSFDNKNSNLFFSFDWNNHYLVVF